MRGGGPAAELLVKSSQAKSLTTSDLNVFFGDSLLPSCMLDLICRDDALLPVLKAAVEKKEVANFLRKMKSSCFTPLHMAAT